MSQKCRMKLYIVISRGNWEIFKFKTPWWIEFSTSSIGEDEDIVKKYRAANQIISGKTSYENTEIIAILSL